MECVGDETSTTRITNKVNQVQQVNRGIRRNIKELIYIIQLQKAEIRLYRRRIDNIGGASNGALTRGDVVSKKPRGEYRARNNK